MQEGNIQYHARTQMRGGEGSYRAIMHVHVCIGGGRQHIHAVSTGFLHFDPLSCGSVLYPANEVTNTK